ncbi:hypothetical protein CYMTET_48094 [Cymbomonas tetramitiformis]|uniref:Uncharacterized protein n=1 Tax=Cymbomonas tetramitiformis TaxID=36881 RepID=A0AAE0EVZ3_9CHLO|nr:hypothetical protein CYMTET_48094 [Cymbomonas tetramitiformis]
MRALESPLHDKLQGCALEGNASLHDKPRMRALEELRASLVELAGDNGIETMDFTASDYSCEEMQKQLQKNLELDPVKTPKSQPSSPEPGAKGFFKTQDEGGDDEDLEQQSEERERRYQEEEEKERRFTERLMQGRYPYMAAPKPQRLEPPSPGRRRAVSMARARMKTLSPIRSKSQEPELNFLQSNRMRSYDFRKCKGGPVACPTSRPIKPPSFCRRTLPKMQKRDSPHAAFPSSHSPDAAPPTATAVSSVHSYTSRKARQYEVSPQFQMDVPDIAMASSPSPSPTMASGLLTQQKFTPSAILGSPSSHVTPCRSQSGRHLFGPLGQDPVTEYVELDVIGTTPNMNSFDMMLTRPTYRSGSGRHGHRSFSASPSLQNYRKPRSHSSYEGVYQINSLLE